MLVNAFWRIFVEKAMLVFPNCKINLGLQITRKRSDGFHDIASVMFPVGWTDMLEIIPAEKNSFVFDGQTIGCPLHENLCYKAYELLKSDFDIPPVSLFLYKNIPQGAGLGGGSSDAAFTLKVLNILFSLEISTDELKAYAAKLGSDCSFFIDNQISLLTGKGDCLNAFDLRLKGYTVVIIKPDIHISTREAYELVLPKAAEYSIEDILKQNIMNWQGVLKNDFEDVIFRKYPQLELVKDMLYNKGALYASMSGSGSAIYGFFENPVDLDSIFPDYRRWQGIVE